MKKLLIGLIVLSSMICTSLYTPTIHRAWLRNKVGSQVVKITNKETNHGGTGVYIKLPSGNVAILTNAHVCGIKDEKGLVYVAQDNEEAVPRRVIIESEKTDLCLVEPLPGYNGLTVSSGEVYLGEEIYVVGHPRLMPNTMTSGEIIDEEIVDVVDHLGSDNCNLPKNKVIEVPFWMGAMIQVCTIHIPAYLSTANILPGNSGSPVVNMKGQLVGLVFAGDSDAHWGILVTLTDVRNFIKVY